MKKLVVSVIAFIAISLNSSAQIEMDSYGNVTIKNSGAGYILMDNTGYYGQPAIHGWNNNLDLGTTSKAIHQINVYTVNEISDKRQKENITNLNNALDIILKLQGVKYDIKKEYTYNDTLDGKKKKLYDIERKNQLGFLAQDVEKVLPEAVNYDDSADVYGINYTRIIPVLVEAIKEQQLMIEELSKSKNTKKSATIESDENVETSTNTILYQNTPNPFTNSTEIKFVLAGNVQNAMLNIYNMNGTQLKSITLHQTGNGSVTINGNEFSAGMYMYALIADGTIVDTKRMVLTD